jgi:hypothetical protein
MSSIVDTPFQTCRSLNPAGSSSKPGFGKLTPGLAWQNPAYRRKFMLRSLATPSAPLAC